MSFLFRRNAASVAALVLLAVLFLAVNMLAGAVGRTARLDLTERALFTLSAGAIGVLRGIDEPITLRLIFSESLAPDFPGVRTYGARVRDMLEEMTAYADGRLRLEIVDPEPFSETEDTAQAYGLQPAPTTQGELIYFGLVGTNMADGVEVIPYFNEVRASYLEYDLIRLIAILGRAEKPRLGVVTNLPLDTGAGGLMAALRGESQPFLIYDELLRHFEVEFLEQDFDRVPTGVDVLMVAHPKPLSEETLYAMDQFVLGGGRTLIFVDPHSEVSLTAGPDGQPVRGYTQASSLPALFAAWGVDFDPDRITADRNRASRVATGQDARRQFADYVLWMGLTPQDMDPGDPALAGLDLINFATTGALRPAPDATTTFEPLLFTTADSMMLALEDVLAGPTPDELLANFQSAGAPHTIAARISGPASSAFPNGPPGPEASAPPGPGRNEAHLDASEGIHLIIVADSDLFDDRLWAQAGRYQGDRLVVPFADNARFVLNAVDNLAGTGDLISLRARAPAQRPFTRIENLRRQAEARYLAEEQALRARIAQTERRLQSLESAADTGTGGGGLLGAQAQEEIARFRGELLTSRRRLRQVQRGLRRDIETLESRVRIVNIALTPLVAGGVMAVLALGRRRWRGLR